MKVLLVNKFHYRKGGSETYYFTLADALEKRGHQVIFFSMKDEKNLPCRQEKYFVSNASVGGGIKSRLNMVMHMTYSKEAYRNMKRLLEDEQPDLVILNLVHKQITLSILDAIRERPKYIPVFWTMHDLIAVCPAYTMLDGRKKVCEKCIDGDFTHCIKNRCIRGSLAMSCLSRYEAGYIRRKKLYDKTDLFICPSDFHRGKLTQAGFTESRIITLRNPLPQGTVCAPQAAAGDYILYFGRLSEEKGVKTLLDAAAKTGRRTVILGTGPQEQQLKEYAAGMDNVEFKGFQTGKTLENYIKNSRRVVLPSRCHENGPYSAIEAMALGKPLIVSAMGGLPELVEEKTNGYIYGTSADRLAESIEKIFALPLEEYTRMSESASRKAADLFSAEKYVKAIEEYYRQFTEKN